MNVDLLYGLAFLFAFLLLALANIALAKIKGRIFFRGIIRKERNPDIFSLAYGASIGFALIVLIVMFSLLFTAL